MTTIPNHPNLRALLAKLYPEAADIRRVAADAGVNLSRVAMEAKAVNMWHALLDECEKEDKLTDLLTVAAGDYPHNQALATVLADHQHELLPLSDIRLLNFGRPITSVQQQQIEVLLGKRIDLALGKSIETQFDDSDSYEIQCQALIARVGFTGEEWQSWPLLVNPPGFVPGALCLISQLHGFMGHFPTVLRLQPVTIDGVRSYAVAEILNLQEIRDRARNRS